MAGKVAIFGTAPWNDRGYLLDKYLPGQRTGTSWWVHSVSGTDAVSTGGQGLSPEKPFATLAYALADSQVQATNGDVFFLMPGHAETIVGAAGINVNSAGISIIGVGEGRARPVFSYTTSVAASFDINSANAFLKNLVFSPVGVDAVTAALNVKAANCLIEDCEFELANGTNQAALGILTTSSANRHVFRRNHFHGTNDAGTTAAIRIVGGTDGRVEDNDFIGGYSAGVGAIQGLTTDAVNLLIRANRIVNLTAVATKGMVFTGSTTGLITQNWLGILSGSAPITCAAMTRLNNYYAAAVDTTASAY